MTVTPLAPNFEAIPAELKHFPWYAWGSRPKEDNRFDKIPIDPKNGMAGKSNDLSTAGTYEQAINFYAQHKGSMIHHLKCRIAGIGVAVADNLVAIDLDKCRNPETEEIEKWAWEIIENIDCYAEVSPSGTGVRILTIGQKNTRKDRVGSVEVYDKHSTRYVTITGKMIYDKPIKERQGAIDWICEKYLPGEEPQQIKIQPNIKKTTRYTDETMIEEMKSLKPKLWAGDLSDYGDDHSAADQALANFLAQYGCDYDQIERLISASGLDRRKWHNGSYPRATIGKALDSAMVYRKPSFKNQLDNIIGNNTKKDEQPEGMKSTKVIEPQKPEPKPIESKNLILPVSFNQLANENPRLPEPIIEGLLRRGETLNIIAASKMGKSWLVYGLVLSIITGRKWFDTFPCRKGRVLLIDNELHPSNLTNRIANVANAMGIKPAEYKDNLDILSLRGRLMDLPRLLIELQKIPAGKYDIIMFDAFYRGLPAGVSENDNGQVAQLYNAIDATTGALNAAWGNVHHSSKGDQSGKAVVDVGAGAGSQSRAADTHLILRPHEEEGVVVLEAAVRSFKPVEPLGIRWNFPLWHRADQVDVSKLKGKMTKSEERQIERDNEAFNKILVRLEKEPASKSQLTQTTGISSDRLKRLLPMLESNGDIQSEMGSNGHNPCLIYSIKKGGSAITFRRPTEDPKTG